jgi:hypothetical protein
MARQQISGGTYQARSVVASAQRCLNLYLEPLPAEVGEPSRFALYPTAGLVTLAMLPTVPVRGVYTATNGILYAVGGDTLYRVESDWTYSALGTITGWITTPVSMSDNGLQLVVVDGTINGWQLTLSDNTFAQISDSSGIFRGGDRVDYLDTYLLFNVHGTPQFISSDSLAVTFDPLWFANKQSHSDLLVSLAVAKREIWLLGASTTEVWYNTGASDFPFASMPSVIIDHGCVAVYSVALHDNAVLWLGKDRQGQTQVLEGSGYLAKRVSTYAMETALAKYSRIDDAIGFTYQYNGHYFYHLTFPEADKTWLLDRTTGQWSELAWIDTNGLEHRHRANCAAAAYGKVVVGDWRSGALYQLDPHAGDDAGQPIRRQRVLQHLLNEGKRVYHHQLIADMEAGTAPAGLD